MEKQKAVCGGFYVDNESGLKFEDDTLMVTTSIPEIKPSDEGKILKVVNGELVFVDP